MKSNWCTYFATVQYCCDFSDQSVRHNDSSVHVQGSCGPYESSTLQTELIHNWWTWFYPAYYVTIGHTIQIGDKIYYQYLSQWWHTSNRSSGQCATRVCLNDHYHVAFIHTYNWITLGSDLVHMVDIFKITYGRLWKSRRRNWIRQSENVGLY